MASETSIIRDGKVILFPGEGEFAFDPGELQDVAVRNSLVAIAVQRMFREASAGKTESAEDRAKVIERCKARFAGFKAGVMETPRGEAVKLDEQETADAIFSYVLNLKRAKGDKRSEKELRKAWDALTEQQREIVTGNHAKGIKKALAARLKAKRKPGADIEI